MSRVIQQRTDLCIHTIKNGLLELEKEINELLDTKLEDANQENQKKFGQEQSPINLISGTQCKHTVIMGNEEYAKNTLKFAYPQMVKNCTILNNGYTVQVNIDPSNECTVNINGNVFKLVQFHFHTPSEHTVDSELFDMEMHLVHLNEKNEIAVLGFMFTTKAKYQRPQLELTKSRAHLVLSSGQGNHKKTASKLNIVKVLNEEESDDCETDDEWEGDDEMIKELKKKLKGSAKKHRANDFLAQFFDQLPDKKTEKDIALKRPISFDYLFETSSNSFVKNIKTNEVDIDMEIYTYKGSLSMLFYVCMLALICFVVYLYVRYLATPPYSEGVNWMVSKQLHFISKKQLKDLSACWENKNNARPCQDYCGRLVKLRNKSQMELV